MLWIKTVASRVALALGLATAAASAHAVPIIIDFTGTVENGTANNTGQTVYGSFVIETAGLNPNTGTTVNGTGITYSDSTSGDDLINGTVWIGGTTYDVGVYASNQAFVSAFDSSGVAGCAGCTVQPDSLTIQDWSMDFLPGSAPGLYAGRRLRLNWSTSWLDFVDNSDGFDPLDLVSQLSGSAFMPSGHFREETWDCAGSGCRLTSSLLSNFSVGALTVRTANVPEPGTLALFGIGLLGGAVARRSAAKGR